MTRLDHRMHVRDTSQMRKKSLTKQLDLFIGCLYRGALTKRCPMCGQEKSVAEFPTRSLDAPRPNAYCDICQRRYNREHYRRNAEEHNQRRIANQRRYKSRNRELKAAYLEGVTCIDCGESDPVVLEFDHVRGKKRDNISSLVSRAFGWQRIREEMAKCEVRCANCHRRRTARQFWHRENNGR
jgi:hypothetical protein